jgi:organic radical activating enzyme
MQLNKQPIEKRASRDDGSLEVHSSFYTIQGEGPFCGTPSMFVRLAGCNLQCPFCDTEYSDKRTLLDPYEILAHIADAMPKTGLVVITGGEPFRQNLTPLLELLTARGYYVQIETNGTLEPSTFIYSWDINKRQGAYIVCSPKTGKVHPFVWAQACCAKYVMAAEDVGTDGLPVTALGHTANPRLARPPILWPNHMIYLQPMDAQDYEENQRNIQAVRESCMEHGYILQLQTHKLIGVE